jgi:hypothetical protein
MPQLSRQNPEDHKEACELISATDRLMRLGLINKRQNDMIMRSLFPVIGYDYYEEQRALKKEIGGMSTQGGRTR